MYFPYLRARQFELIALRDLVSEGALQGKIIPVIEPVKETFNNLNLAHKIFSENNFNLYLIVNPFEGDVSGDTNYFLEYITNIDDSNYLPAFHYSDNQAYISFVDKTIIPNGYYIRNIHSLKDKEIDIEKIESLCNVLTEVVNDNNSG